MFVCSGGATQDFTLLALLETISCSDTPEFETFWPEVLNWML